MTTYGNKVDLHTHSNVSDGSMSPAELVRHAIDSGLQVLALTDHDTIDGLSEAIAAAKGTNLTLVSGVELAAWYDKKVELHIVGLFVDHEDDVFKKAMKDMQEVRESRNERMVDLMQRGGIDITLEQLTREEGDGILTRANFAAYLKNHGYVGSINEAFDRYLDNGKPFYIPRETLSPDRAIQLILGAGGIPILAHPMLYKIGGETREKIIRELIEMGLLGMETYYSMNTPSDTQYCLELARRYNLLRSGGSDYHGTYKPHIEIGKGRGRLYIPMDDFRKLQAFAK